MEQHASEEDILCVTGQIGECRMDVAYVPASTEQPHDAERIRRCLEGCDSVPNPEAVPKMLEALRMAELRLPFMGSSAFELLVAIRAALALAEGKE